MEEVAAIVFLLQRLDMQRRVLTDVLLKLLGDEDQRVRHAAANAFCRYAALLASVRPHYCYIMPFFLLVVTTSMMSLSFFLLSCTALLQPY